MLQTISWLDSFIHMETEVVPSDLGYGSTTLNMDLIYVWSYSYGFSDTACQVDYNYGLAMAVLFRFDNIISLKTFQSHTDAHTHKQTSIDLCYESSRLTRPMI